MLFHYFISKIRFGFAKHTYSLIFTLKIGWKHAWTAKLYRFRGLFYALNCRKCYCIEADSNMPSYHVFFAIFTSFVSFWTYPSLTNRHSPTPCPPLHPLFIPNKFVTFDDCYVKYYYYNWSLFDAKKHSRLTLHPRHHSTIESLLDHFNRVLEIYKIKIRAKIVDGKVVLEYYEGWEKWHYSNTLFLSPNLAHILGFKNMMQTQKMKNLKQSLIKHQHKLLLMLQICSYFIQEI